MRIDRKMLDTLFVAFKEQQFYDDLFTINQPEGKSDITFTYTDSNFFFRVKHPTTGSYEVMYYGPMDVGKQTKKAINSASAISHLNKWFEEIKTELIEDSLFDQFLKNKVGTETSFDNIDFTIDKVSNRIDDVINKLENTEGLMLVGQEIIYKELHDLKEILNDNLLSRKNWVRLFAGSLFEFSLKKLLSNEILNAIFEFVLCFTNELILPK